MNTQTMDRNAAGVRPPALRGVLAAAFGAIWLAVLSAPIAPVWAQTGADDVPIAPTSPVLPAAPTSESEGEDGPAVEDDRDGDASDDTAPTVVETGAGDKDILVQLNNLQPIQPAGCRFTFLATNERPEAIERLGVEIVVFDAERRVDQFLMMEFTRLAVGKTKVAQFDLAERACEGVSQLLVNDVLNCGIEDGSEQTCTESVRLENLTDIDLAF